MTLWAASLRVGPLLTDQDRCGTDLLPMTADEIGSVDGGNSVIDTVIDSVNTAASYIRRIMDSFQ